MIVLSFTNRCKGAVHSTKAKDSLPKQIIRVNSRLAFTHEAHAVICGDSLIWLEIRRRAILDSVCGITA